jgi:glutamate/aspartate transport system permease protein
MNGFDPSVILRAGPFLLEGMAYTLTVSVVAMVGGILFGTLLALARLSPVRLLALPAAGYVNLMRSVPLILVVFWFFFLVPELLAWLLGRADPVPVGADKTAFVTFTLFEAAYYCEVIRAGIQSVPKGQAAAAKAIGLTPAQAMVWVILPQAFRAMAPVLLTQTIILFQDTSLLYVISATDFLGAASKIAQRDGRLVEMYLFAALVYFACCFGLSKLVAHLQHRLGTRPARA